MWIEKEKDSKQGRVTSWGGHKLGWRLALEISSLPSPYLCGHLHCPSFLIVDPFPLLTWVTHSGAHIGHGTQAGQPIIELHAPDHSDWFRGEDTWPEQANGVLRWDFSSPVRKWNSIWALVVELLGCDPGMPGSYTLLRRSSSCEVWEKAGSTHKAAANTDSERECPADGWSSGYKHQAPPRMEANKSFLSKLVWAEFLSLTA